MGLHECTSRTLVDVSEISCTARDSHSLNSIELGSELFCNCENNNLIERLLRTLRTFVKVLNTF